MDLLIEKKIQTLLSEGSTCNAITKKLIKTTKNPNAFLSVYKFMYLSGLHKLLIKTALSQLKNNQILPWAFIIEILEKHKVDISKDTKLAFIDGIIKQNQISAILTSPHWDNEFPELKTLKLDCIKKIDLKTNKVFLQLIDDLVFVQAQGILLKEKEILQKLKEIQPHNPAIQEKWFQYLEKWGRNIIRQKKHSLVSQQAFSKTPPIIEHKQAKNILNSVKKIVKKTPKLSYNMGLLFSFIGYPKLALNILKNDLHNVSSQWLYLDLLIESKLFLECLPLLDKMETQYSTNPETIFALTYLRAQAYYGLGKKQKAKKMLHSLLEVRPNYRLSHYLLKQWEERVTNFD